MDTYVGFDSAWTDSRKAPGAICSVMINDGRPAQFHPPELVSFDQACTFIQRVRSHDGCTLIALDQPTVVPNATGMRPVERVAASLVSWLGGGVQPANRGKVGMFCDASPIWRFIAKLGATEDPEQGRTSAEGIFLIEVFPALALASLDPRFFGRLCGPRYNPGRKKTFRADDWVHVAEAAACESLTFGCGEMSEWCLDATKIAHPRKADQDMLDAVLCVLTALRWRLRPSTESLILGDMTTGYMVLPASTAVHQRLIASARKYSVPVDGR